MSGCVNIALRDILAGSVAGGYGASHAKQAAQLSRGLLCLLCACGAGVLGFVHGSALFRGWVGDFGGVVHEIRLFHG